MSHSARVYRSLDTLLQDFKPRFARKMWKRHTEKHGNVPLVMKCAVCSGRELKMDVKLGKYRPPRPSRILRDEARSHD